VGRVNRHRRARVGDVLCHGHVSPLNVNQRVVWLASVDVRFALYFSIGVVFQQQARIPPLSRWTKEVRAHRPSGCMDINRLGIFDNHPVLRCGWNRAPKKTNNAARGMEARIRSLSLKRHCQGHSQSVEIVRELLRGRRRFLG